MNELIKADQAITMSSREIAELTGKEHRNVMRDIRTMLVELHGEGGVLRFEHTHRNEQNGQEYSVFQLPKRETLILVSGYNLTMRAKIIDRWQELEQKAAIKVLIPDFTNPAAAARAWAEQFEAREAAVAQLEEAKPAVEFVGRYVEAKQSQCISDVAKIIGWNQQAFFSRLNADGIIFKRGIWLPYQEQVDAGRFEVKAGEENGFAFRQTRVTPKGITWLAEKYGKDDVPEVSPAVLKTSRSKSVSKHN